MSGHTNTLRAVTWPRGPVRELGAVLGAWKLRDGTTVNVIEDTAGRRRICVTIGTEGKAQLLMTRAVTIAEALALAEIQLSNQRIPMPETEAAKIAAATVMVLAHDAGRALMNGEAA